MHAADRAAGLAESLAQRLRTGFQFPGDLRGNTALMGKQKRLEGLKSNVLKTNSKARGKVLAILPGLCYNTFR